MNDAPTISLSMPNGNIVSVEVTLLDTEEDVAGRIDGLFAFSDIGDQIVSIADALQASIEAAKPKSASVEFGIQIGVDSGNLTALLVKGTGTANLKITLTWSQ